MEFVGAHAVVHPGDTLTFGRAGDIVIDESNQFLHRVVGRFYFHRGLWWLENLGRHIELDLIADGGSHVRLAAVQPGEPPPVTPLTSPRARLAFEAGGLPYELELAVRGAPMPAAPVSPAAPGVETSAYGHVDLSADMRRLLVLLAEPVLRDPSAGPDTLPANKEIARRLGWSVTTFNRRLDRLCARLTRSGVRGLQGARGAEATTRRWRLVEHAISARLVTRADLDDLT